MIIYIDMDDVICNFSSAYKHSIIINPKIGYPQSQFGFFQNLVPMNGAIESVNYLREKKSLEVYILTAPSTHNPFSYTEKRVWIEKYFDYNFVERLIICSNKSLLKGDLLIDDNQNGKGQEKFEGELLHFGSDEFPNWNSIIDTLELRNIC